MRSFPHTCDSATRGHRLRSGISLLTLALTLGATAGARAATYEASNQTELNAAIAAANNDGDASSTITLTGNFSIAGNSLPVVTKSLTIDIGANILTSAGPTTFNVGAGAELTVDGRLRVTGTPGFSTSGRVLKEGEGTLNITGGPSGYAWYVSATTGAVVFKDGAVVNFDSTTGPVISQSTGQSSVTATGIGTVVTDLGGSTLGTAEGATLNVEAGAHYINSSALSVANVAGSTATVNVTGDGSLLQGSISVSRGLGIVRATEGGHITSTATVVGGVANASTIAIDQGGTAQFLVSGDGSRWDNSGHAVLMRGSLDVLDGGVMSTSTMRLGFSTGTGVGDAAIRVSGEGSEFVVTSAAANAFQIGGGAGVALGPARSP